MKSIVKSGLRKSLPTNLLGILFDLKSRVNLYKWEKEGCPLPPPHIVKQLVIRDFKSKYKRVVDVESNLNLFKKIINEIPRGINYLVLLGVKKGNSEILDVIKEKFELKEKFKNCYKKMNDEDLSRFSWMNKIIGINKLERIEFKLGKVK